MKTKMKIPSIVFLVFILLFSYQNCSEKKLADETSFDENRRSLTDLQVNQVKFSAEKESEIQKASNTFKVRTQVQYVLDPETGVLAEYDEAAETFATYCLTENLLVDVRSILSGSRVCTAPPDPPDVVCTMAIVPSYAEIVTQNEVLKLGYSSSGCMGGSIDLCDSQPNELKSWIDSVRSQLPQLGCGL